MRHLFLILLFFTLLGHLAAQQSFRDSEILMQKGDSLYQLQNYSAALSMYAAAFQLFESTDSVSLKALLQSKMALMNDYLGNYNKALKLYLEALLYFEKMNDIAEMARVYNNIGALHFFQQNFGEALIYYEQSLKLELKQDNQLGMAQSYENIGIIYKKSSQFSKAEDYYLDAYQIYKSLNKAKSISNVLVNLGSLKISQNEAIKGIRFLNEALLVQESNSDFTGMAFTYNNLADAFRIMNRFPEATKAYEKAADVSLKIGLNEQIRYAYLNLAELHAELNNFQLAYFYFRKFSVAKDSVFNQEKSKQFAELQTKYETEKKELLIKQQSDRHLQDIQKIRISIFLLLFFLGLIILLAVLYVKNRNAYRFLAHLNKELALQEADRYIIQNENTQSDKYSASTLSEEQKSKLKLKLLHLLDAEKVYLNPNLSLDDLAKMLKTNKKYVSQLINEDFKSNFNHLINQYRIKDARVLLLSEDNKKLNLEGIAEKCGFNNRVSFTTAFKRITGLSPSYYIKNKR
jgi:AraC-like DNA-binding protein